MSFVKTCVFAGVIGSCGSAVFALPQPIVELAFSSGRVTVNAVDAPAADVLRVWADVGHTQVTGIENLGLRRITLRLSDAPEEAALTTIIGQRSWFNARSRDFSGVSQSTLGRIDILPAALSASVATPTPEQRYEYSKPPNSPEVAAWAANSTSVASPRPQPYPETMYDYPQPSGFGDPFKILATANASNEQPIVRPGTAPPVPERMYEYPRTPELPAWMSPARSEPGSATPSGAFSIPDIPVVEGFNDGSIPGERVDPFSSTITSRSDSSW